MRYARFALLMAAIVLAHIVSAGWNDLLLTSLQDGTGTHQGGNITLTLTIHNNGVLDGNAAYISEVTLLPSVCINGGEPIRMPTAALSCPNFTADNACEFRFRNATLKDTFIFENVPTQESCGNGEYKYSFAISGNSEVGNGGVFSRTVKTKNATFGLNFTGPFFCGDGICTPWKGENCETCNDDCGRCAECNSTKLECVNDSLARCVNGFWNFTEICEAGCHLGRNGTPECVPPCVNGDRECASLNVVSVCINKRWKNETCQFGCVLAECKGNCDIAGCFNSCADGVRYYEGVCDHVNGKCAYQKENCSYGCSGEMCAGPDVVGGGFGLITLLLAGLAVIVAAFVVYIKFVRKWGWEK